MFFVCRFFNHRNEESQTVLVGEFSSEQDFFCDRGQESCKISLLIHTTDPTESSFPNPEDPSSD